jgi:hypothetical protein
MSISAGIRLTWINASRGCSAILAYFEPEQPDAMVEPKILLMLILIGLLFLSVYLTALPG